VQLAEEFCRKKSIPFDRVSIRAVRPDETLFDVLYTGERNQGPILAFPTSWFWRRGDEGDTNDG